MEAVKVFVSLPVAEGQSAEQLQHEAPADGHVDLPVQTVEVLLKVLVAVLEDQGQLLVRVQDVYQAHDVLVLQLLRI